MFTLPWLQINTNYVFFLWVKHTVAFTITLQIEESSKNIKRFECLLVISYQTISVMKVVAFTFWSMMRYIYIHNKDTRYSPISMARINSYYALWNEHLSTLLSNDHFPWMLRFQRTKFYYMKLKRYRTVNMILLMKQTDEPAMHQNSIRKDLQKCSPLYVHWIIDF